MSSLDYSPPPDGGDGGKVAGVIILNLVILGIIIVISCYCAKRARRAIVSDLRSVVAPPVSQPHHVVQVGEVDAPTMEKFLQELAREKPVRFTAQQLCTFTSNYSTKLGSGGFGVVYKGQFPNGVKIAVKVLERSSERAAEEQFMAEVGTIGRTYHINMVRLYGFCYDQFMSALVYEFMENGSLDKYLFKEKQMIEWDKLHEIAIGTARGIAYLHEECQQRIIHYDIKPENILLDAKFCPKVADFGLAKLCNRDLSHVSNIGYRGTPGYSAPECFRENLPIKYKCDVYSFGMVLFEIVGRRKNTIMSSSGSLDWFPKHVWEKYKKSELVEMLKTCGIEEKDIGKAEKMSRVALWCIQGSPEARPQMSTVVKMLEGSMEVTPPPKPLPHMLSSGMNSLKPPTGSTFSLNEENNSYSYKDTTPTMAKYEIQMASR